MEMDNLREEVLRKRELQSQYKKRLRVLELQKARLDIGYVPSHIVVEVDDVRESIEVCEQEIQTCKDKMKNIIHSDFANIKIKLDNHITGLVTLAGFLKNIAAVMISIADETNSVYNFPGRGREIRSADQYKILINDLPQRDTKTFTTSTISLTRISEIVSIVEGFSEEISILHDELGEIEAL